ncbi:hypothetical protein D3C87_1684310 [compost metagenome]
MSSEFFFMLSLKNQRQDGENINDNEGNTNVPGPPREQFQGRPAQKSPDNALGNGVGKGDQDHREECRKCL